MAKARRIPGLDANEPYGVAASRIVEVRVAELMEQAQGVLDVADIKRVHDMRVATRRLRAALEIFGPCFPRQELKGCLRQVKQLADALGERRDRDVSIAALEEIAGAMAAPDRPGIETLIARLRVEQADANAALAQFVGEDKLAALCDQLTELAATAAAPAGSDAVPPPDPAPPEVVWLPTRAGSAA
jgi:CHAD domain-containing protein